MSETDPCVYCNYRYKFKNCTCEYEQKVRLGQNARPWFGELVDFKNAMGRKIWENMPEKGLSWKTCDLDYLKSKLKEYADAERWVDVANIAFMLWLRKHDFGSAFATDKSRKGSVKKET